MQTMKSACERRWRDRVRDAGKIVFCFAALVLLPLQAAAGRPKQFWVRGTVSAVEAGRIGIIGPKGREFTVIPSEDFSSRVAVGSQVTAWYTPENGVNRLDYLQLATENFFVPPETIQRTVRKVLIIPHPNVPGSMDLINEVGEYLATNVGWFIAPTALGEELWKRAHKPSPVDAIDRDTGQFDMALHRRNQAKLMADLTSKARVDAVLDITVEQVEAPFKSKKAEWDEVSEMVATKGALAMTVLSSIGNAGTVPAATVAMNLYDQQGRILWNRRRGFAVLALETGIGSRFRERPLTEVLQNQASVQAWLGRTFARLRETVSQAPNAEQESSPK